MMLIVYGRTFESNEFGNHMILDKLYLLIYINFKL